MFHIIFTMICVLCSLCAFDKRALFQKGHDIIVYVRHVFQTNPKTGEPEPSDLCKTCKHIDKCTGYMDTKYGRDKSMPDFPCDMDNTGLMTPSDRQEGNRATGHQETIIPERRKPPIL